ncbi:MAG TPA: hypothetical protein VLC07_03190 [Solirubrobacterales bacterium]|nr:hypothetical protein [Solirubrobacterales bacterium]
MSVRLPCQVCERPLVPLKDGTSRRHTPGRPGNGGGEYARCPGSGYRLARWPVGQRLWHHTTGIWEIVEDRADSTPYADYLIRCVKPTTGYDGNPMEPVGKDLVAHGEYMHRHGWTPAPAHTEEKGEGREA